MNSSIYEISIPRLLLSLLPIAVVLFIYFKWSLKGQSIVYATLRMFVQLILIGYALIFIFEQKSPYFMSLVLLFMLLVAAWISLRPIEGKKLPYFGKSFLSLFVGCIPILILMVTGIIDLDPWYEPKYIIPLSGMLFANAMNSVSVSAERFQVSRDKAQSLQAGLIPIMNTFFAVGLVSLPGIMTGQILAGISPLIAVRYQIMIMATLFGASGISAATYLFLIDKKNV